MPTLGHEMHPAVIIGCHRRRSVLCSATRSMRWKSQWVRVQCACTHTVMRVCFMKHTRIDPDFLVPDKPRGVRGEERHGMRLAAPYMCVCALHLLLYGARLCVFLRAVNACACRVRTRTGARTFACVCWCGCLYGCLYKCVFACPSAACASTHAHACRACTHSHACTHARTSTHARTHARKRKRRSAETRMHGQRQTSANGKAIPM